MEIPSSLTSESLSDISLLRECKLRVVRYFSSKTKDSPVQSSFASCNVKGLQKAYQYLQSCLHDLDSLCRKEFLSKQEHERRSFQTRIAQYTRPGHKQDHQRLSMRSWLTLAITCCHALYHANLESNANENVTSRFLFISPDSGQRK